MHELSYRLKQLCNNGKPLALFVHERERERVAWLYLYIWSECLLVRRGYTTNISFIFSLFFAHVSIYGHRFDGHSFVALIFRFWLFVLRAARVGYDRQQSVFCVLFLFFNTQIERTKHREIMTKSFELVISFRCVVQTVASVAFRKFLSCSMRTYI